MYADKFHSKSKPPKEPPYFCTFEWYYNLVQKFGSDKQAKFQALADEFGKPNIALVANKFGFSIKDVNQRRVGASDLQVINQQPNTQT